MDIRRIKSKVNGDVGTRFFLFTLAYIVRASIEMILYFLILSGHIHRFTFNLLPQLYIFVSDVLPITHVLYVHNRIYGRVETSSQIIAEKEAETYEQALSEDNRVMIKLSEFDVSEGHITLSEQDSRTGSYLTQNGESPGIRIDQGTLTSNR